MVAEWYLVWLDGFGMGWSHVYAYHPTRADTGHRSPAVCFPSSSQEEYLQMKAYNSQLAGLEWFGDLSLRRDWAHLQDLQLIKLEIAFCCILGGLCSNASGMPGHEHVIRVFSAGHHRRHGAGFGIHVCDLDSDLKSQIDIPDCWVHAQVVMWTIS